jgi:hypothetical protein
MPLRLWHITRGLAHYTSENNCLISTAPAFCRTPPVHEGMRFTCWGHLSFLTIKFHSNSCKCIYRWVLLVLVREDADVFAGLIINFFILDPTSHPQLPLPNTLALCLTAIRTSLILWEQESKLSLVMPLAFAFFTGRVPDSGDEHHLLFSFSVYFSYNISRFIKKMLESTSTPLDPTQWLAQ